MADRLKAVLPSKSRELQSWADEPEEHEQLEGLGQIFRSCVATDTIHSGPVLPENIANFSELLANYSAYVNLMIERRWHMTLTDRVLSDLRCRVQHLENRQTLVVPVETLADETFELIRPFSVVVEPAGDEFTATLYDANVSASGETTDEAVSNLKDMLLETLELFDTGVKLGAAMQKQKAVLKSLVRQKQVSPT
jgi:predicted RNase H-like HicB family nuclease